MSEINPFGLLVDLYPSESGQKEPTPKNNTFIPAILAYSGDKPTYIFRINILKFQYR